MKPQALKSLIQSNGHQIFSVSFTKKDGTTRQMTCRLGVKAPLKGGSNTVAHIPKYLTVFDMTKQAYRNINTETITEIKMQGLTITQ